MKVYKIVVIAVLLCSRVEAFNSFVSSKPVGGKPISSSGKSSSKIVSTDEQSLNSQFVEGSYDQNFEGNDSGTVESNQVGQKGKSNKRFLELSFNASGASTKELNSAAAQKADSVFQRLGTSLQDVVAAISRMSAQAYKQFIAYFFKSNKIHPETPEQAAIAIAESSSSQVVNALSSLGVPVYHPLHLKVSKQSFQIVQPEEQFEARQGVSTLSKPQAITLPVEGQVTQVVETFEPVDVNAQQKSVITSDLQAGISLKQQLQQALKDKKELAKFGAKQNNKGKFSDASNAVTTLNARIKLLDNQIAEQKVLNRSLKVRADEDFIPAPQPAVKLEPEVDASSLQPSLQKSTVIPNRFMPNLQKSVQNQLNQETQVQQSINKKPLRKNQRPRPSQRPKKQQKGSKDLQDEFFDENPMQRSVSEDMFTSDSPLISEDMFEVVSSTDSYATSDNFGIQDIHNNLGNQNTLVVGSNPMGVNNQTVVTGARTL